MDGDNTGVRALVIEIKSFLDPSAAHSIETALGQYEVYRTLLEEIAPQEQLYLAISDAVYAKQFQRASFQLIVRKRHVRLVIVDVEQEEVIRWMD